jgi:hypothetical protein
MVIVERRIIWVVRPDGGGWQLVRGGETSGRLTYLLTTYMRHL